MEAYIQNGGSTEAEYPEEMFLLHIASTFGYHLIVKLLIEAKAKIDKKYFLNDKRLYIWLRAMAML